ncbi:hypothetical protein WMF41_34005 [Sorangium sp. So ce1151]
MLATCAITRSPERRNGGAKGSSASAWLFMSFCMAATPPCFAAGRRATST